MQIGPLAVLPADGAGPLLPGVQEVSARTQERIDEEVRRIVEDCHREVLSLLAENRAKLDSLAAALIEHETLDEDDAYAAAGVEHARPAVVGPLAVAAKVGEALEPLGLTPSGGCIAQPPSPSRLSGRSPGSAAVARRLSANSPTIRAPPGLTNRRLRRRRSSFSGRSAPSGRQ